MVSASGPVIGYVFPSCPGDHVRYENIDPDQARAAQLAARVPQYTADALFELYAERRQGKDANVSPVLSEVLGIEPTSFDQLAEHNVAIFRGEQPSPRVSTGTCPATARTGSRRSMSICRRPGSSV